MDRKLVLPPLGIVLLLTGCEREGIIGAGANLLSPKVYFSPPKPFHPSPIQLGIRKGDKEWHDFVDDALLEMMTTGEYWKLMDKWFRRVRGEFLERAMWCLFTHVCKR